MSNLRLGCGSAPSQWAHVVSESTSLALGASLANLTNGVGSRPRS
jgi:hypothetical protein